MVVAVRLGLGQGGARHIEADTFERRRILARRHPVDAGNQPALGGAYRHNPARRPVTAQPHRAIGGDAFRSLGKAAKAHFAANPVGAGYGSETDHPFVLRRVFDRIRRPAPPA